VPDTAPIVHQIRTKELRRCAKALPAKGAARLAVTPAAEGQAGLPLTNDLLARLHQHAMEVVRANAPKTFQGAPSFRAASRAKGVDLEGRHPRCHSERETEFPLLLSETRFLGRSKP